MAAKEGEPLLTKEDRADFRKYLEANAVTVSLAKILFELFEAENRPEDPMGYIRDRLAKDAEVETYKEMRIKIEEAHIRIRQLSKKIERIRTLRQEREDSLTIEREREKDREKRSRRRNSRY